MKLLCNLVFIAVFSHGVITSAEEVLVSNFGVDDTYQTGLAGALGHDNETEQSTSFSIDGNYY